MKALAIAAATIVAGLATSASAQYYDRDGYQRYAQARDQECFNPRAGHFERVRPGEVQNDLDFRNCRLVGAAADDRYAYDNRDDWRARRDYREGRQECWNPRARHYEEVRGGERQDDLDFSQCRTFRD